MGARRRALKTVSDQDQDERTTKENKNLATVDGDLRTSRTFVRRSQLSSFVASEKKSTRMIGCSMRSYRPIDDLGKVCLQLDQARNQQAHEEKVDLR